MSKNKWGGVREGAGRPESDIPKERVSLLVSEESNLILDRLKPYKGILNKSEYVDYLISLNEVVGINVHLLKKFYDEHTNRDAQLNRYKFKIEFILSTKCVLAKHISVDVLFSRTLLAIQEVSNTASNKIVMAYFHELFFEDKLKLQNTISFGSRNFEIELEHFLNYYSKNNLKGMGFAV